MHNKHNLLGRMWEGWLKCHIWWWGGVHCHSKLTSMTVLVRSPPPVFSTVVSLGTVFVTLFPHHYHHHHHHHQSLNLEGRWGTTDDFATSFLHFSLFSTALWDLLNSRPVHSLMLSSHLFLCPPCLLPLFHCALQDGFGQTWWTGNMTIPLQFASFYDRQEVFVWSNCLLDLGTDFLVGNMVLVWDV